MEPGPLQKGLIAVTVLLFALPLVAWSQGVPIGLLMLLAGGYGLYALDPRSRRVALALIAATAALVGGAWLPGRE